MSRFSRSYESALNAAGLSKAEAAASVGIHPSTLGRILSDEMAPHEQLEKLLHVLPNQDDRRHCLREFLFDQTPRDEWENLIIHFGQAADSKALEPSDNLSRALVVLDTAATEDPELKKLLIDLAAYADVREARFLRADAKAKRQVESAAPPAEKMPAAPKKAPSARR